MSHISYWMNAAGADANLCHLPHTHLPAIESIRFICSTDTFTTDTLYLGYPEDLSNLLQSAKCQESLHGITFFLTSSNTPSRDFIHSSTLNECNIIVSSQELLSMYDHLNSLMLQYRTWNTAFQDVSRSGHTIQDIVDTAARFHPFNIFLLNTMNRVIVSHIDSTLQDPVSSDLQEHMILSAKYSEFLLSSASQNRIYKKELFPGYSCWIYQVTKQGTAISHMLFIGKDFDSSFDIYEIMELTRHSIHKLMADDEKPAYWAGERFKALLDDIVKEHITDHYEINQRLSQISCESGMFCTFIIIGFSDSDTLTQYAPQIFSELEELFPDNNTTIYEGCIVIMLARPTRVFQPKPIFDSAAFTKLLKTYQAYASISNAASRRSLMRTQYLMTKQILDLGRKLFPDSRERYFFFEDYVEYLTIDFSISNFRRMYGHDDIFILIHPDAMKLVRYDKEHKTNLLELVYYYCLCNCNINHTAKCVYMHRNTASNRLNQVNELISADLENGEVQQRMIFSYKLYQYYSRYFGKNLPNDN